MSIFDWLHRAEEQASREAAPPVAQVAGELRGQVIQTLRTIYDPEIPVNIYDLGLIYGLDVDEATGHVEIRMTLTAPGCPVAQTFPRSVAERVLAVDAVREVKLELVWEPRWSKELMSEAARLELGLL